MNPQTLLEQTFGFPEFRPGQQAIVETLLAGRSALAVFPTGSGKSLCYQLPALAIDGLTVVVSPLLSLMKDQVDQLRARGIAAARLDSSQDRDEQRAIEEQVENGTLRLLYAAPERFASERFQGRLRRCNLALLAIDEAHCISEWGHNFRPDYLRLAELAKEIGVPRVLALTATATPDVVCDIQAAFGIESSDTVVTGFARPNLILRTTAAPVHGREDLLVQRLARTPSGPTIVYVTQQKTAERVAEHLRGAGLDAQAYHAGLDDQHRASVQEHWMRADDAVVVATIAFGMGIDKANVRRVFHYNLPKSLESYSQEIGRAGRDGHDAWCEVLANAADIPVLENFACGDTPTREALDALLFHLLSLGERFDIGIHEISSAFDIRLLVLRTILTVLELDGVLRLESRWFAKVEWKPETGWDVDSIADAFGPVHGAAVRGVFAGAEKGRLWYRADPQGLSTLLGIERSRLMRMLDVMEERGMVQLRTADQRLGYVRGVAAGNPAEWLERLVARFEARESAERQRVAEVVAFLEHPGCRTAALAAHFGQTGTPDCGRCSGCTGESGPVGVAEPLPDLDPSIRSRLAALAKSYPDALGLPRQQARFLCGLSSPATSKLRLGRHELFGTRENQPMRSVLDWLSQSGGTP